MIRDIVIVGNGGFAKEIAWLIERINQVEDTWNFLGFIDKNNNAERVIGRDSFLLETKKEINVVIAIGDSHIRKKLYEEYRQNKNLKYPNIIDPSVIYSPLIQMGKGNIICAGTVLTVDIQMGDFNIVNLDCTIGHEAMIGNYVTVNPSVNVSGNVKVDDEVSIGTGTQIIQGLKIGGRTIVGAGAVVTSDLPEGCTAVGVPAKVIRR